MTDWQSPGTVTIQRDGDAVTVRITGNFHRDIPVAKRDALRDQVLGAGDGSATLLVDLSDLIRLDSWGEGKIAKSIDHVIAAGGAAAVLSDPSRPNHLRSLAVLLARHGDRVRVDHDDKKLRGWLEGRQG